MAIKSSSWIIFRDNVPDGPDKRHPGIEISKQRDRGAAIIAAAIVEDHLVRAIKSRFERNEVIENKLFKGYGPFASFSAKIDLAVLIGVMPMSMAKNLHRMKEIRNEFAHNLEPLSFMSQRIKALCSHLRLPSAVNKRVQTEFSRLAPTVDWRGFGFARSSQNPRTQFMSYGQFAAFYLALQCVGNTTENWTKKKNGAPQPSSDK